MVPIKLPANFNASEAWGANWLWGLPLIVLTVLIHVAGLDWIRQWAVRASSYAFLRRHHRAMFMTIIGSMTVFATVLHGFEAYLWAWAYRHLGALPDRREAMLYSLNAITSYGHVNLHLEPRWELMGALESLNGWLLFGLSTAYLFAVVGYLASLDRK
jgi:hypothetical protein